MPNLSMPKTAPRIPPLQKQNVGPYVRAEYDKSIYTWGIPNNLIKTMAWLPRLAETEVDYANSFIFDVDTYADWPNPDDPKSNVVYPQAGFIDRVTKELVINIVGLLNRSRYSITHHAVIGFNTLAAELPPPDAATRKALAEAMMLHLVDAGGKPDFENQKCSGRRAALHAFQLHAMRFAVAIHDDAHSVSDEQFKALSGEAATIAKSQIESGPFPAGAKSPAFVESYVRGMLVELSWCICHFNGLLNNWFTVLRVMDETDAVRDEIDFVTVYNTVLPDSIKARNNSLLGSDGWGS